MIRESEFWWLVGILEGEGYFGFEKWSQRIQVKMTDLDVIERVVEVFSKITGREHAIHESPNKGKNDSLPYVVSIHGDDARKVMRMIVPHMGFRRRQRIWQSLNEYKPPKKGSTKETMTSVVQALITKSVEETKPNIVHRRVS